MHEKPEFEAFLHDFRLFGQNEGLFLYFALFGFFEFGGVLKCLVYDFAFAACQFWLPVFDNEYAVMLAAFQCFEVP